MQCPTVSLCGHPWGSPGMTCMLASAHRQTAASSEEKEEDCTIIDVRESVHASFSLRYLNNFSKVSCRCLVMAHSNVPHIISLSLPCLSISDVGCLDAALVLREPPNTGTSRRQRWRPLWHWTSAMSCPCARALSCPTAVVALGTTWRLRLTTMRRKRRRLQLLTGALRASNVSASSRLRAVHALREGSRQSKTQDFIVISG
jgi:hypothetical protein